MNVVIVIPAIDPDGKLNRLVDELRSRGFTRFIVVDDGSGGESEGLFSDLELDGVCVLHHAANLGKGAALKTGLSAVRKLFPEVTHIVTVDADGQHLAKDVERVARAAEGSHDHVVIGTRDLQDRNVPVRSRIGNAFSSIYFKLDTGLSCPDTQTGLRAIPVSLLSFALSVPGLRYEYEMNFLTAVAKRSIPLVMVPISAVYTDGNVGSHFSTMRDSLCIYGQFFRFAGSSLVCAVADLLIFALIAAVLDLQIAALVTLATVAARMVSGVLNFTLNRCFSFHDLGSTSGNARTQGARYMTLFLVQMCASAVLVTVLSVAPVPLVLVKALVDGLLFVMSYFVQRNWVFKRAARKRAVIMKGGERGQRESKNSFSAI